MSFLDEIIDPIMSNETDQKETTSRRLNYMIAVAMISSEERNTYEMQAFRLSEEHAQQLCEKLKQFMPQVGYHTIPQSVSEQGEAIRYAVDKDNYYYDDRHFNTSDH